MGLILDSSILVAAERRDQNSRQVLQFIASQVGPTDIAISVITLAELAHGAERADTPQRKSARQNFLHELQMAVPIYPVTSSLALRAGQIDGRNTAVGISVSLADLLIGVTALELGYGVATGNVRHFRLIPGLQIIPI